MFILIHETDKTVEVIQTDYQLAIIVLAMCVVLYLFLFIAGINITFTFLLMLLPPVILVSLLAKQALIIQKWESRAKAFGKPITKTGNVLHGDLRIVYEK